YRGTKRPVDYSILDAILSVSEGYSPKMQNTENQHYNPVQRTNCPHNKVATRTNRNKKEIKGIVNNSDERNASLNYQIVFYKTTNPQDGKKENKPAVQNVKVLPLPPENASW